MADQEHQQPDVAEPAPEVAADAAGAGRQRAVMIGAACHPGVRRPICIAAPCAWGCGLTQPTARIACCVHAAPAEPGGGDGAPDAAPVAADEPAAEKPEAAREDDGKHKEVEKECDRSRERSR